MHSHRRSLGPLLGALVGAVASVAQAQGQDCIRSEPEPLVAADASGIASHQFKRVNSHQATERLTLTSGLRYDIEHGGCEYYVISFSVRSNLGAKATLGSAEALTLAAQGLRQLNQLAPGSGFDLGKSAAAIDALRQSRTGVVADQEYPVEGDGEDFLQTRVMFNANRTGAVRFRLIKGPL